MADVVFIVDKHGKPLMPSKRNGKIRHLLDEGKAVVIKTHPFTVRLKYETTHYMQNLHEGVDSGRENIGNAVSKEDGENILLEDVRTNNRSIKKNMMDRHGFRSGRRRHHRQAKQRKAKSDGTEMQNGEDDKWLTKKDCMSKKVQYPSADNPVTHKVIHGKEAKFANRTGKAKLTPSGNQLVQITMNVVEQTTKIMPITHLSLERVAFDFQKLENADIRDWNHGPMYGFKNYKEYIRAKQNGVCPFCGRPITQYHHIVPKSAQGAKGSNTVKNIVGLCDEHHRMVHQNAAFAAKLEEYEAGQAQKYKVSLLNSVMPVLIEKLEDFCKEHNIVFTVTEGYETKQTRQKYGLNNKKDHCVDAYAISLYKRNPSVIKLAEHVIEKRRFKKRGKNNINALNQREYILDGKMVARNRHKAMNQKSDSLEEFLAKYRENHTEKEVQQMLHRIVIKPDRRTYTGHKKGLVASAKPGDVVEYRKFNKTSGITKHQVFVATSYSFDGRDKNGSYCPSENRIGYAKGKKEGNRRDKFCTVLESGCLQVVGYYATSEYLVKVQQEEADIATAKAKKANNNKAHKDLIPMGFSFCSDGFQ